MEYRKRCKVCGKIWCYTDEDLKQDTTNSLMGGINAIGQIASAFGGTVFHQQYFADRSENIDRKRVNRNQCPECHSLDSEEISAEELEDYKTQESFSKVQVSINSNATTENLLTRAKLLLEDKDWASANAYCLEKAEQTKIETERKEAALKAKKTKNSIIIIVVLIVAAVAGFFAYSSSQKAAEYNEAVEEAESYDLMSMVDADEYLGYFWTIDDFTRLGDYKDSAARAEAMREEAYKTIFDCLDEGVGYYGAAYRISEELGDYKDCPELTNQIKEEYDRFYVVYSAEEITEEVIEAAKSVIAENEYVKSEMLSNSLYFFETLHNVEWECVSGDNRTLSMAYKKDDARYKNTWPTITTEVSEKGGWNGFRCITFRHGEQGLKIGATNNSKCEYDRNTLTCEWIETAFVGADYTVNLTEQGTLHIVAERNDGVMFECEYKRIG